MKPGGVRHRAALGGGVVSLVIALAIFFPTAASTMLQFITQLAPLEDEADLPPYLPPNFDKENYMNRRAEYIGLRRGVSVDQVFDPQVRMNAIRQMEAQEKELAARGPTAAGLLDPWVPLGPAPIPNGQTVFVSSAVSGRTTAIAVHPTNPNIVYVGTAQGGLYRTTDGGSNWTPMMDGAMSLAIGAVAIAPSQPDTVYVGTGEAGLCSDCFFGVGVYRIDDASAASPVLTGPLNRDGANNDIFSGRSIGDIVVHPTLPGTIFVGSTSGIGGIGASGNSTLPARGLYRSTDATSGSPTFVKLNLGPVNQNQSVLDLVMDPGNSNLVLCTLVDSGATGDGGVYRSTNALAATPAFARTLATGTTSATSRTELAVHRSGGGVVTVYAASGVANGTVHRSLDGGATWSQRIDNDFCSPQCFYDIAVAVDPTNADRVYIGGAPTLPFGFSINGGTSFTWSSIGLHVDTHAIEVAPSLPSTVYFGSDGGVWKSTNSGVNWTSLNNGQFSATQFMSVALHPTDRYFSIGGTQDNGTNLLQANQTWTRTEGGDGGYAVIDQNATDTSTVTMYHTFFSQANAMGYSRTLNAGGAWTFFGCGMTGATANGMTCAASDVLFYAPLERGPGHPNTLYFGSDVLYRSANSGTTVTKVSQEPILAGVAISAIGIAPQDDDVRLIGLKTGGLWGTSTGSATLVDLDASNAVPNAFVARTVIDPNTSTTAYVTLSVFGQISIWKTTNLSAATPTWTAAATGVPAVPVNALVIDPFITSTIYAGTDIGVYRSADSGANWIPFGTGLPRVAVFDMEILDAHRKLRIATHGRGFFENSLPGGRFTDDPLTAQNSIIKAIHIAELRSRINELRTARGLSVFSFTDTALTPTVIQVKATHIVQLRSALNEAYGTSALAPPTYTDPDLSAMAVKALHIAQLRTAVLALEAATELRAVQRKRPQ